MYIVVSFVALICFYIAGRFGEAEIIDILRQLILPVSLISWGIIVKGIMKKRKAELDKKKRCIIVAIPCSIFPTYLLCAYTLEKYLFYKGIGIEHLPFAAAEVFSIGVGFSLGILVCVLFWTQGVSGFIRNKIICCFYDDEE